MIVKCKECGKDVSTEAAACPACGYPQRPADTPVPEAKKQATSHIFGWVALIAFLMSNFIPAIIAPIIVLVAIVFSLLEIKGGGRIFGSIVFFLCLVQVWAIANHFGGLNASLGLTNPKQIEQQTLKKYEGIDLGLPANSASIIQEKCSEEWPADFRMRSFCEGQQQEGIAKLNIGMPPDVQPEPFRIIRGKCANDWPRDFKMRAYCEAQQYEGYRSLQATGSSVGSRARCAEKWPEDYKMRKYCESKG